MANNPLRGISQQLCLAFGPGGRRDAGRVHAQMCALTTWFVSNVAFSDDFVVDHHGALARRPFDDILIDLIDMKYGTMCGGLSLFMSCAAKLKGYDAIAMNFGDNGHGSHVMVLVTIDDGERILYDPTLGCFSGKENGKPVSIRTIIDLLRQGKGEDLRWIQIGPSERPWLFRSNSLPLLPITSSIRRIDQSRSVAMVDLRHLGSVVWNRMWQWGREQIRASVPYSIVFASPLVHLGKPKRTRSLTNSAGFPEARLHQSRSLRCSGNLNPRLLSCLHVDK